MSVPRSAAAAELSSAPLSPIAPQTRPWEAMVIVILGVLYCSYLLSFIPGQVYFSGDAGIKLLMTRQALDGYFGVDLRMPGEPWLQELWNQGAYPFKEPFVYHVGDRYIQAFPVFFAWMSAPFYAMFGWPGLYVIPMAAGIATWTRFYILCRQLAASRLVSSVGLLALVLGSPLTLYCAAFWEHTLAACLTLFGMAELLLVLKRGPSTRRLVIGGVLIALAAYLRPENICFALIVLAIGVPLLWQVQGARSAGTLGLATGLALAVYLLFNFVTSGRLLGMHSAQVVGAKPFAEHLIDETLPLGLGMFRELALTFPLAYLALAILPWRIVREWPTRRPVETFLGATLLAIACAVPIIAPNNGGICWGPRYIISFIPLFCLAATLLLTTRAAIATTDDATLAALALSKDNRKSKAEPRPTAPHSPLSRSTIALRVVFGICLVWGLGANLVAGTNWAWAVYVTRIWPLPQMLAERPERFVAVTDQRTAHELTYLIPPKSFLLFDSEKMIERASKTLHDHGQPQFLMIVAAYDNAGIEKAMNLPSTSEPFLGGYRLHLHLLGLYGANYVVYEGFVTH